MTEVTTLDRKPADAAEDVSATFRDAMRNFPATVCILTARGETGDHGMTATAVCSVSMDPPSLMICVNNRTLLHAMLLEGATFAVNVLGVQDRDLSDAFSGAVPPEKRFASDRWVRHPDGMRILQGAAANLICHRKAAMPFGTHTMFVGEVSAAMASGDAAPLVYANAGYCGAIPLGD